MAVFHQLLGWDSINALSSVTSECYISITPMTFVENFLWATCHFLCWDLESEYIETLLQSFLAECISDLSFDTMETAV